MCELELAPSNNYPNVCAAPAPYHASSSSQPPSSTPSVGLLEDNTSAVSKRYTKPLQLRYTMQVGGCQGNSCTKIIRTFAAMRRLARFRAPTDCLILAGPAHIVAHHIRQMGRASGKSAGSRPAIPLRRMASRRPRSFGGPHDAPLTNSTSTTSTPGRTC